MRFLLSLFLVLSLAACDGEKGYLNEQAIARKQSLLQVVSADADALLDSCLSRVIDRVTDNRPLHARGFTRKSIPSKNLRPLVGGIEPRRISVMYQEMSCIIRTTGVGPQLVSEALTPKLRNRDYKLLPPSRAGFLEFVGPAGAIRLSGVHQGYGISDLHIFKHP